MLFLTIMIFVKEGKETVFHEFEELAIPIINDYKGKLIYRIRPSKSAFISYEEKPPYEIHFLSFETENDFSNFLKDKRREDFLHLKNECISFSYIVKGEKI